jgi:hypothetical protein
MKILMRSLVAAGALAAGLALPTHDAAATVVNLTNPNFDANVGLPPNSDNYITATTGSVAIPGWTIVGSGTATSGTLAPMNPGAYFNTSANWSPPQVGAVGGTTLGGFGTSSILQNTGSTWNGTSGTVTVTLSLGEALGTTLGTSGMVQLLEGGVTFGTPINLETGGTNLVFTPGAFDTETYTFTGVTGTSGQSVGLEFTNPDPATVFLDNITLDGGTAVTTSASSIPEPRTGLPLLGIALLGFVAFHYRQKTKMLAI